MKEQTTIPGVSVTEEDIERHRVLSVSYHPKAEYAWATGIAMGRFLKELKAGKVVGTKCNNRGRIVVPPRIFCEYCFCRVENWVYLPDTGVVNTFSISHIAADTTRLKSPIIPAVVTIDGTTNAGLLHLIGGVKPENVRIGMSVKAVWIQPDLRKGSITDIKYFAPISK